MEKGHRLQNFVCLNFTNTTPIITPQGILKKKKKKSHDPILEQHSNEHVIVFFIIFFFYSNMNLCYVFRHRKEFWNSFFLGNVSVLVRDCIQLPSIVSTVTCVRAAKSTQILQHESSGKSRFTASNA